MKKNLPFFAALFIAGQVTAQEPIRSTTEVLKGVEIYQVTYSQMKDWDGVSAYNVPVVKLPQPDVKEHVSNAVNPVEKSLVTPRGTVAAPAILTSRDIDSKAFQPADNTIAVGENGVVVTATNNNFSFYDTSYTLKKRVGLQNFFGVPDKSATTGQQMFDPQVMYDPLRKRWIVVADYIEFNLSNNDYDLTANKVYLAISKTDSLTGGWYVVTIPGIHKIDNEFWASDFPTVSFTATEMFIMASLSKFKGTISHQVAYEIDFKQAYAGNAPRVLKHYFPDVAGFTAAHNNFDNPNTRLCLLHSSHNAPALGTRNLDIAYLESNVGDTNNHISPMYHLDMACYYFKKNSSPQKGSPKNLAMAGSVIRSCFYDKGVIHAVFTTVEKGKTAIFYLRLKPDYADPEFSKTWCTILSHPDYDLGYAAVNYGGIRDADSMDGVLISANYTSKNEFPGYGVYYVAPNGGISDFNVIHSGWGYYQWPPAQDTPVRWGDYTGIAMQHSKPGRFAVTGQYGTELNTVGNHFAILDNTTAGIRNPQTVQGRVYPNPVRNSPLQVLCYPTRAMRAEVRLLDLSGKVLLRSPNHFLKPGTASVEIQVQAYAAGTYLLEVLDETTGTPVYREKVQIVR